MKILLKYVGLPILALIGIYLLLCSVGPKDFDTEQSIKIEAPAPVVYNLINNLKKTERWNPWFLGDTSIVTTYNDVMDGVGAESSWTSEEMAAGTEKIIEAEKNLRIKSSLEFADQPGVINHSEIILEPNKKQTKVTWTFVSGGPNPFLTRGMMLVMGMKSMMKKSYKEGLQNLKELAEDRAQNNVYNGYKIVEKGMPERNYILNRQEVKMDNIQQFYATNLGSLFNKVQTSGVEMDGMPSGLFFKWDEKAQITDMAAAIPVKKELSIDGASSLHIEERKGLQIDFYGDFNNTPLAHEAMEEYMKDHGYFQDPPIIEEYVTDPTEVKDPNKWLTKISYYFSE
jgi:effector-binding domain-containing protein